MGPLPARPHFLTVLGPDTRGLVGVVLVVVALMHAVRVGVVLMIVALMHVMVVTRLVLVVLVLVALVHVVNVRVVLVAVALVRIMSVGVVLVLVALVRVVHMSMVLMIVALVHVMHMPRLVPVVLVVVALMHAVRVGVVLMAIALVRIVSVGVVLVVVTLVMVVRHFATSSMTFDGPTVASTIQYPCYRHHERWQVSIETRHQKPRGSSARSSTSSRSGEDHVAARTRHGQPSCDQKAFPERGRQRRAALGRENVPR